MSSLLRRLSAQSSASTKPNQPVQLYLIRLLPTCRIVWLYLAQHKIPYTLIDIKPSSDEGTRGHNNDTDEDFSEETKLSDLPQHCPHRQVPILVDGDITVFEAPAILRYLSSRYTNYAGYGATLATRMMTESLISWINSELYRLVSHQITLPQVFKDCMLPSVSANELMVEHGIKRITRELESLQRRHLNGHKYLGCRDERSVADSFAVTVLLQLQWVGFSFELWPKVCHWLDDVTKQEFWEDVHTAHALFVEEMAE
ncbi:glutathione S-transferase-like [Amphiura filiformis]|uniref:glutathione S-transferase-like n=1 Tax=Amphiura filiformis TaxID=82378 RepID=UPI003B2219C6